MVLWEQVCLYLILIFPLIQLLRVVQGSNSYSLEQPEILPDRFESGTQNLPGIVGLKASTEFIMRRGVNNIANSKCVLYNIYMTDFLR